jgi:hypothetical protein
VSVIVISMVLVVIGFVTLMLGVLGVGEDPLQFVYISIGACLVAAVFLIIGVVRGRPAKKPVAASGGQGAASWSGASAWNEQGSAGETAALQRDEPPAPASTPHVQVVTAEEAAGEARERADESAFAPPASDGDTSEPPVERDEPAAVDADDDDEVIAVVPKRTAAERAAADDAGAPAGDGASSESADDPVAGATAAGARPAAKRTTRTSSAKKASAKKAASKASTAKTSAKKATAKKAAAKATTAKATTAKKASAKKTSAKKTTARKAGAGAASRGGGDDGRSLEEVLANVTGVGPAKQQQLTERFGSIEALRAASPEELQEINGISDTLAARIKRAVG